MQCRTLGIARELIRRGADVRTRMPAGPGSSVLQLAVTFAGPREVDHARMMKLVGELIDRGADPTDAIWAACHVYHSSFPWRIQMIELLLARGADPDRAVGTSGNTTRELMRVNAKKFPPEVLRPFAPDR